MKSVKQKTFLVLVFAFIFNIGCQKKTQEFVTVSGSKIIDPKGNVLVLKGTNLGNWLHPEGYMFKFKNTNSAHWIDEAFKQMIGPDETKIFWNSFLDSYVTRKDIAYLKSIGCNHVRVPFNYRMLNDEDYLGTNKHGFKYLDSVVDWCKNEGMWVLLDMHAVPGGQTGDNIDDSFGYPFLFKNEISRQKMIDLWVEIASSYANEPTVLGYDLMNEPIATYFEDDFEMLNTELEPLYKRIVAEIRKVDTNHLVFLGGAQWNTNFDVFNEPFDDKAVYTFHKYWFDVDISQIQAYIDFRDKYNVPLYMGESGENTDDWVEEFRILLDENEISWCFWPYKKMENTKGIMNFEKPDAYHLVVDFVESDRSTYKLIRDNRPPEDSILIVLNQFIENSKFENCFPNEGYIKAMGFTLPNL